MNRSVAYLTSFYGRVGDTFIRREVEELRRLGWTVHTFSIRRADESEKVSEDILREQQTTDYILEQAPLKLLAAFARTSLRTPGRMIRAIRQARAIRWPGLRSWLWHWFYLVEAAYLSEQLVDRDVALLHDHITMGSATVALLASTLSDVPFSMTVHGVELLSAEKWGLGQKIARSSATICISGFGKSQCMLFSSPEQWHKLHEVRCGLDATFLDAPSAPISEVPRLVCVGRLSPEKGQLILVDAAALLREQGISAEFVLVGDGPSRIEIERRVRERGLTSMVRLVGWQSSSEIREWILRSRALVLPSFSEGIPVVLMEAMALRRPVIATWVGGIPELVEPGENGWLVPAGSVEDLARAVRDVLGTQPEELFRLGERGRRRVQERHDLRAEARKLAVLFERAIGLEGEP